MGPAALPDFWERGGDGWAQGRGGRSMGPPTTTKKLPTCCVAISACEKGQERADCTTSACEKRQEVADCTISACEQKKADCTINVCEKGRNKLVAPRGVPQNEDTYDNDRRPGQFKTTAALGEAVETLFGGRPPPPLPPTFKNPALNFPLAKRRPFLILATRTLKREGEEGSKTATPGWASIV